MRAPPRRNADRFCLRVLGAMVVSSVALVAACSVGDHQSSHEASGDPVARGRARATELGCTSCHATDGKRRIGPPWNGLYGSQVPLAGGGVAHADDAYLRESILDPNAKLVEGFAPATMPPYRGRLSDAEVADLVAYIESLK